MCKIYLPNLINEDDLAVLNIIKPNNILNVVVEESIEITRVI